jgi:hypothetical protein
MMNIFSEYLGEIVPFREYWEVTFEKKENVCCCTLLEGWNKSGSYGKAADGTVLSSIIDKYQN